MTVEVFESEVPTAYLKTVEDRVSKMARRCVKKGLPVPTLTKGETFIKDIATNWDESAGAWKYDHVEYTRLTLSAEPVRLNGWRLAGVVTPALKDGQTVPVLTAAPGESLRDFTTDDPLRCEYCKRSKYRTETFVVRHDDGRVAQVGRNCLADFLGHDPSTLIQYREWLEETIPSDEEVEGWGHAAPRYHTREDILMAAARVVTKVGFYVSRKKADESYDSDHRLVPTAGEVWDILNPLPHPKPEDDPAVVYPLNEAAQALFDDTLEGIKEMLAKDVKGDWEWSLEEALRPDAVQPRQVGTVASAVILGTRRQEWRAREREAREAAKKLAAEHPQEYIGKVGERVRNLTAEVTFIRAFDSNWSGTTTHLVRMLGERGTLVWWASNLDSHYDIDEHDYVLDVHVGDKVTITGTVKRHEPDRLNGLPTTVLTRCKMDVTECGHEKQETPQ